MAKVTMTTILNETRPSAFETMCKAFEIAGLHFEQVGDSTIAMQVGATPDNKPIFALFSPEMKPFETRTTASGKVIKAFDLTTAVNDYAGLRAKREEEAEKAKEAKARKIEADRKRREANAKAKAEREQLKKDKG